MLKVIRPENDVVPTTPVAVIPQNQGFALVRTSQKSKWTVLTLPFTIGSQTDSDIVVNAPTMRGVSKVVAVQNNGIVLVDAQTQNLSTLQDLKLFGIEIHGPFSENPAKLPNWRRSLKLALNRENQLFKSRYPNVLRRVLPMKQASRLGVIGVAVLVTVGAFALSPDSASDVPDLSNQPIPAKHGNVQNLAIESSGLHSSYAKGLTIQFSPAEVSPAKQYVLTLNVSGLDLANELSIEINGKFLGSSSAQLNCVDSYCALDYAVPADALLANGNVVRVVHNSPESRYELKNAFFRTMEPASAEEMELMRQLLVSAERYHEERFLLAQNIRTARDAVEEIDRLMTTRTGVDDLKPKFAITKAKVMKSFQDISSDLQFKVQKELKLNHQKVALGFINDMLKLYPDPASKQNSFLMQQKKKLEEVVK